MTDFQGEDIVYPFSISTVPTEVSCEKSMENHDVFSNSWIRILQTQEKQQQYIGKYLTK